MNYRTIISQYENSQDKIFDLKTIRLRQTDDIDQLIEEFRNNQHENIIEIQANNFIFLSHFENEIAIFLISKKRDTLIISLIDRNANGNDLTPGRGSCINLYISNISDEDGEVNEEFSENIDYKDVTINIPGIGKYILSNQFKKTSDTGYFSHNIYINSETRCYGPTDRKGTWIVKLQVELMRSLGCKYIFLQDAAHKKDRHLYTERMTSGKKPLSWYGSFGYKCFYDLDYLFESIEDLDIKGILEDIKIDIPTEIVDGNKVPFKNFLKYINTFSHDIDEAVSIQTLIGEVIGKDERYTFINQLNIYTSDKKQAIKYKEILNLKEEIKKYVDNITDENQRKVAIRSILKKIYQIIIQKRSFYFMIL